jgi:hypothetical protein
VCQKLPMIGCEGGGEAGRKLPLTSLVGDELLREVPDREVGEDLPAVAGGGEEPLPRKALTALAAIREESFAPTDKGSLQSLHILM